MTHDILVVRFSSLGDVVLVSPVVRALRGSNSDARITLLTRAEYADLYRHDPHVDAVWAFDAEKESLGELSRRVRAGGFSAIVDLHGSIRSRLVCLRSRSTVSRYRKQSLRRAGLVAPPPFKIRSALRPVVDRYLDAAGPGSVGRNERIPAIYLPEKARNAGAAWSVRMRAGRAGRLIVLLPHAKHAPKEWPLRHFDTLAQRIAAEGDLPVVLPAAGRQGSESIGRADSAEVLPGVLDLGGALAAAEAVVTNDSGPMHLAAALGTPVLGLFGPTSPELGFAPIGHADVVHLGLYCSPCSRHGKRRCWRRGRYCMTEMTPERVFSALNALLEGSAPPESP